MSVQAHTRHNSSLSQKLYGSNSHLSILKMAKTWEAQKLFYHCPFLPQFSGRGAFIIKGVICKFFIFWKVYWKKKTNNLFFVFLTHSSGWTTWCQEKSFIGKMLRWVHGCTGGTLMVLVKYHLLCIESLLKTIIKRNA